MLTGIIGASGAAPVAGTAVIDLITGAGRYPCLEMINQYHRAARIDLQNTSSPPLNKSWHGNGFDVALQRFGDEGE